MNNLIAAYIRTASPDYSIYLAQSVHFAMSCDGGHSFTPLNKNYGILFPKCRYNEENGIVSRGVCDVQMVKSGDTYIISGCEIERHQVKTGIFMDSKEDVQTGAFVCWTTKDFVSFSEPERCLNRFPEGISVDEESKPCAVDCNKAQSCSCTISVSSEIASRLSELNKTVEFEAIKLPENVTVKTADELDSIKAEAIYTDGSTHLKKVIWNKDAVDFTKPGQYEVDGRIFARRFPFPVEERAWGDPIITLYEGKYYFIGTDDWGGNKMYEIRCADTPEDLFRADTRRVTLLEAETSEWDTTFWAPEFHIAGGRMCIFGTLGKGSFDPQSHVMRLKEGGDMMNPDDWEKPIRCVMPDGRYLSLNPLGDGKNGITLDMTYFEVNDRGYAAWSFRTWAGTDSGSMIMIAEVDPKNPWQLLTYPKLLTRPDLGWENIDGTDNNEGPHPIVTDDKVYLAYSGGNAAGDTYVVGMMTAEIDSELSNPDVWTKSATPWLASNFVEGELGCGHNGFFIDELGDTYITYHGHKTLGNSARIDGVRRVHFKKDGSPLLYMTNEQDLPIGKEDVKITITVK